MRRLQLALPIVSAVGASACDISFPNEYLIEDLRVLEIRSEPPEIPLFEPGAGLSLDPMNPPAPVFTPVKLTALVAHPDLEATYTYDWIRCRQPFNKTSTSAAPFFHAVPCEGEDRERLQTAPGPELVFSPVETLTRELLDMRRSPEELVRTLGNDPLGLLNGIYAYVNVSVGVESAAVEVDTPELEATKRVVIFDPRIVAFTIRQAQNLTPGDLPQIAGVELPSLCVGASDARVSEINDWLTTRTPNIAPKVQRIEYARLDFESDTSTKTLVAGEIIEIAPGQRVQLEGKVIDGTSEPFKLIDGNCELQSFDEEVAFSWFTSRGALERQLTHERRPTTEYTAPPASDLDEDRTRIRIWTVLRDGRGGSDSRTIEIDVVR